MMVQTLACGRGSAATCQQGSGVAHNWCVNNPACRERGAPEEQISGAGPAYFDRKVTLHSPLKAARMLPN